MEPTDIKLAIVYESEGPWRCLQPERRRPILLRAVRTLLPTALDLERPCNLHNAISHASFEGYGGAQCKCFRGPSTYLKVKSVQDAKKELHERKEAQVKELPLNLG